MKSMKKTKKTKKTKKVLCLATCLVLTLGMLAGCKNEESVSNKITETTADERQTEVKQETEDTPVEIKSVKINGVDISEYKLVYRTDFSVEECYEAYPVYVMQLAEELKELTGAKLTTAPDTVEATKYEIVLGTTLRRSGWGKHGGLKADDYCVAYEDGKILLGATCLAGVVDAAEAFKAHIVELAKANGGEVDVSSTLNIREQKHVTRIVCVGDSITWGGNNVKVSYPTKLEFKLGYEYDVINYGKGNATMCDNGVVGVSHYTNHNYMKNSGYYDDVLELAPRTDVVIIMLGTNDGIHYNLNADEQHFVNNFKQNLTKMVTEIRNANKDIRILLCSTPLSGDATLESKLNILRPVEKQMAEQLNVDFFDLCGYMSSIGFTDFGDRAPFVPVHPTEKGNMTIATELAEQLKTKYGFSYVN